MPRAPKALVWLSDGIAVPPLSREAGAGAGARPTRLTMGERLVMPVSRPMPAIGIACHELRIRDERTSWRIVYHLTDREVVILDLFAKKTRATPGPVMRRCRSRLARFLAAARGRA